MIKKTYNTSLMLVISVFILNYLTLLSSHAHCQIPCGIYDDYARIQSMLEDVKTIQKSIRLIYELTDKNGAQSKNLRYSPLSRQNLEFFKVNFEPKIS